MRRPALALAACAVALAACGGDDDDDGEARTVTAPVSAEHVVRADEYRFDPKSLVLMGRGGRIELTLENDGTLAHNLRVFAGDRELGGTPTFPAGERRSGTVVLRPGGYRLVCTVGSHEQLGMTGSLEVR